VIVLLALSIIFFFYIWIETQIRPIVQELANSRVRNLASTAINGAMADVLARENVDYNDLITLEKDANGSITAIKTNMIAVNRLKTEVCTAVLHKIQQIKRSDLSVPLGNVFKNEMMSGRGPDITVRLVPHGSAIANFQNVFSEAGINQTRHQIVMDIEIEMGILTVGRSLDITLDSQIVVAETIIVGDVPKAYADLNKDTVWNIN